MNSGLSDSKLLSGKIVLELNLLSKGRGAWLGDCFGIKMKGFGKKGSGGQVGEKVKVNLSTSPVGGFLSES